MITRIAPALVLAALTGLSRAQSVDLRIVQESPADSTPEDPQPHTAANPTQNYAVQARVNGGAALGGFVFDIIMPGEPDTSGTLARLRIQDSTGAYYHGPPATSSGGGHVGMAYQFYYLAGISAVFNGMINVSAGGFTNSPAQQEIGNMTGDAVGAELLATPSLDPLAEGNIATWPGYGAGETPANLSIAPLAPDLAGPYFAQGEFVDVYRFRYTISNAAPRTLRFSLHLGGAQTFTQFVFNNGQWGAQSTILPAALLTVAPLDVPVEAIGACCAGTYCSTGTATACGLSGGSFQGVGAACGLNGNPTICCPANFDQINGVQVQDIFTYLNAWFAGDPRADVNGGGLQVQDIFDFLNAWFVGCT